MCYRQILSRGAWIEKSKKKAMMNNSAGAYVPMGSAYIHVMRLQHLIRTVLLINSFFGFDSPYKYDIIPQCREHRTEPFSKQNYIEPVGPVTDVS